MVGVEGSAKMKGGVRMRAFPLVPVSVLAVALALAAPAAGAAGFSVSRLLPRINLDAMLEVERASPAGAAGAPSAADPVASDAPRVQVDADTAPDEADEAIAPAQRPKAGAGPERAPRWKSLIPGALK
jgi:hypothetical protein